MATNLLYLNDFSLLACSALVVNVLVENGRDVLILDQTVFYPQGGGQSYDQVKIESTDSVFKVEEVRFSDDGVKHIGMFENGIFKTGDTVQCSVNKERRQLNSRIHSAGHVIDAALEHLGIDWVPGRGYHFPEGPFVEYTGELGTRDPIELQSKLEEQCNQLVENGFETKIVFMKQDEMRRLFKFEPKALSEGQLARIIYFGDFGIPCGGTHVSNSEKVGKVIIKKIKQHKDIVRIAYDVVR